MAADFFGQQEQARRQSRTLIWLFALALLAIIVAVNGALALLWIFGSGQAWVGAHHYPTGFFATNTLVTVALIGGGTLIQSWNLREGGAAVARMAGGSPVPPDTHERRLRQLLNVVQEMALAAGIACPRVYVLQREPAINAFAAGYHADQAVLAVTAGALQRLTRDELQGVVAHEFSHILNGDMRLNVRLLGILFGIQMIAGFGQMLMHADGGGWNRSGTDDGTRRTTGLWITAAVGATLFAIGYIGVFLSRMIKAALSRQREFLADASAVQFTRNPDGIGGALRKIGGLARGRQPGSRIAHPNAEQLSHLFLAAPRAQLLRGWLASHPPLAQRLRRIYGHAVGWLASEELTPEMEAPEPMLPDLPYLAASLPAPAAAISPAAPLPPALGDAHAHLRQLPPPLRAATRESQAASALVIALLLEVSAPAAAPAQLSLPAVPARLAALVPPLTAALQTLPRRARLPLLDLALPALRQLSLPQRLQLLRTTAQMIAADRRVTLAEFVLQTVLQHRLDARSERLLPIRYDSLARVRAEIALLLSLVAQSAASAPAAALPRFLRAGALCAELELGVADLCAPAAIHFSAVNTALQRLRALAPLQKPALIKVWLAAARDGCELRDASADLLHALCAALDAPAPPLLLAAYSRFAGGDG